MMFATGDLVVRYRRDGPPALDRVTMAVPPGSLYAVLGPNGSGKSTLLRALLGAVSPSAGQVRIGGRPLGSWSRRELARCVGVVTQAESVAFPLRARELVSMGRYPHRRAFSKESSQDSGAVARAMAKCDVAGMADRDVGTLSGGEFQRVRLARALAQEPIALVLDEPTANLDIRHEMEILVLLRRSVDAGLTVLLITHHLELAARFADHLLLLDRGRVAAEGTVAAVLREDTLRRVYGWPIAVLPDPLTGSVRVTPLVPGPSGAQPDPSRYMIS